MNPEVSFELVLNGRTVRACEGESLLKVAQREGTPIPTLCFLEGLTKMESCGVCVVEVEGQRSLLPACASRALPGMVVNTESPRVSEARRTALELLLSDHLGDCLAPCERACPADIAIPDFIRAIREGETAKALAIIQDKIAFTGVLGRVCPRFCERVCRRKEVDEPVAICSLKRFPADSDQGEGAAFLPSLAPSSGKKVAIVGAGIVGLTAAYYLRTLGHDCAVFESRNRAGGALDSILPEFRMPREVLNAEIARVERMGAQFHYGRELGKDLELEELRKGHDAVLLAVGAGKEKLPEFPGDEFATSGIQLLNRIAEGCPPRAQGQVLVIGSGPSAMDTCRSLLRVGAEQVVLLMEPSLSSSLFFKTWIADGLAEGVVAIDEAGHFQLGHLPSGRFRCHYRKAEQEVLLEVDGVYLAGHVEPDLDLLRTLGLQVTHQGARVDRHTLATNLSGVFAAGNIAQAGRYAVQGSAAGRQAAYSIDAFLAGKVWANPSRTDIRMHNLSDLEMSLLLGGTEPGGSETLQPQLFQKDSLEPWGEVLSRYPAKQARNEAARCLSCDCAAKNDCTLRELSDRLAANPKRFGGERPAYRKDASHPEVVFESGKCVRCGRCIAVAEKYREELGLTFIGRGFHVEVGVPFGRSLAEGLKVAARECAEVCPTGALALRRTKPAQEAVS
jgi:formate dehydrogenase major subunit